MIIAILLSSCTQTGYSFKDCSESQNGEIALDIALENMENISDVVSRADFICKEKIVVPPNVECYIVRMGDRDFGNRATIVVLDRYIGECVLHELYHVELSQMFFNSCNEHSLKCGWDWQWLELLLNEYKEIKQ